MEKLEKFIKATAFARSRSNLETIYISPCCMHTIKNYSLTHLDHQLAWIAPSADTSGNACFKTFRYGSNQLTSVCTHTHTSGTRSVMRETWHCLVGFKLNCMQTYTEPRNQPLCISTANVLIYSGEPLKTMSQVPITQFIYTVLFVSFIVEQCLRN